MADFSQLNELLLNQINCGQLSHAYIFRGQQAMEQALSLQLTSIVPMQTMVCLAEVVLFAVIFLLVLIRIAISWSRIKVLTVWKE